MSTSRTAYSIALGESLNELRKEETLCDVTVAVDDIEYPCHSVVLSAATEEYYKTMFTVDMKENLTKRVEVKEIDSEIMKQCIEHMYTGNVSFNDGNIFPLLRASALQRITALERVCWKFIVDNFNVRNCLEALEMSKRYEKEDEEKKVISFILANFEDVAKLEEFFDLDVKTMEDFMRAEDVNIDEKELFMILMRWVRKDLGMRDGYLGQLLPLLRFNLMSMGFILDTVMKDELVRAKDECMKTVNLALKVRDEPGEPVGNRRKQWINRDEIMILNSINTPGRAYNPKSNAWRQFDAPLNISACASFGKKIFCFVRSSMHIYDKVTDSWSTVKVEIMGDNFAIAAAKNEVIIAGGIKNETMAVSCGYGDTKKYPTVKCFDILKNEWTSLADMELARSNFTLEIVNDCIYAIGGKINNTKSSAAIEMLNLGSDKWCYKATMLLGRHQHVSAVKDKKIYVMGGFTANGSPFSSMDGAATSVDVFDTTQNTWFNIPTLIIPEVKGICVLNDTIYFASGDSDGKYSIKELLADNQYLIIAQKIVKWEKIFMISL